MADPLDDAQEKLKRARAHLTNLKRQATKLGRDPDRHRILVDYDSDQGEYVVFSKMSPEPLPNLSLILGDLVHCARGALDFVAWQLAVKHCGREPPEKEANRIQFPITPCLARFDDRRLWPYVSQKVRREMLRHQPHPGSDPANDHLAVIQWISNRDKHRLIVPLFAFINPPPVVDYTYDPRLPVKTVSRSSFLTGPQSGASDDEIFYKGDPTTVKLGSLNLTPHLPNTKIYVDPQPPLDILFSGPDGYLSLLEIEALLSRVEFVVSRFERFL
jgi:hypothetical protein